MPLLKNLRHYKDRLSTNVRIDPDVRKALKEAVKTNTARKTMSDIVNEALREHPDVKKYLS